MQSESKVEFSNISNTEDSGSLLQVESDVFSLKKRRRGGKSNKYSKKEEERILKYALKLSEKEFHASQLKNSSEVKDQPLKSVGEVEEVTTYLATEEDFKDPLSMFDRLWSEDQHSSGILKIVPPIEWVENQKENYIKIFKTRLQDPNKKLFTRKQKLSELYLAKVNNIK
jgi:uncharacterized protein YozE (UPF0346 family)